MHVCNLGIELVTHLEYFCDSVLELNNNYATFRLAVLLAGIYKSSCCTNFT